jgi:hypothetical protein
MEKRYIYGSLTRISDLELYPFDVEKIEDKALWETGDYVVGKYVCPKCVCVLSSKACELARTLPNNLFSFSSAVTDITMRVQSLWESSARYDLLKI